MDDDELVRILKEAGYEVGPPAKRDDGVLLYQVNDVFMFWQDAVDLAEGAITLVGVVQRNVGKVFPKAPPSDYERFQARVFQELTDLEEAERRQTVESLLVVAKARGLSIDDVLRILDTQGKEGILEMLKK